MSAKISVYCKNCGQEIHVLPTQLGREVRCRHCHGNTLLSLEESPPEEEVVVLDDHVEEFEDEDAFAPIYGRRVYEEGSADLTTMVDVTFLLLIFFMVTAAFAMQRSIEVPPPQSSESTAQEQMHEEVDPNAVVIRILKDDSVHLEDQQMPSRQELLAVLREMTRPQGELPSVKCMQVFADGHASYKTVIMVLDCGNAVGLKDIQLKTEDQE